MNPWPTYSFLKSLSGMTGRDKNEIREKFNQIIEMDPEEMKEGCVEFSLMFVKEKGVHWN